MGETKLAAGACLDRPHRIVHLLNVYLHLFGGSGLVEFENILLVWLAARIIKGLLFPNEIEVIGVAHDVSEVVRDDGFLTELVVDIGMGSFWRDSKLVMDVIVTTSSLFTDHGLFFRFSLKLSKLIPLHLRVHIWHLVLEEVLGRRRSDVWIRIIAISLQITLN